MGWDQWIRKVEIAPSLTGAKPDAVAAQVEALLRAGCRIFHLDDDLGLLERIAPLMHRYHGILDVRLSNPGDVAAAIALGADSVTVEAVTHVVSEQVREASRQLGVVFDGVSVPDIDLVSVAVDAQAPLSSECARLSVSCRASACKSWAIWATTRYARSTTQARP
jgi:hypothetical protein